MGFQVSDKFGAAIVVVSADDWETFTKNIGDMLADEEKTAEYLEWLTTSMAEAPKAKAVAAVEQKLGGQPAAASGSGPGPAPSCSHGTKTFLTKPYKNKPGNWKAWACPADRDDPTKCELEFIN